MEKTGKTARTLSSSRKQKFTVVGIEQDIYDFTRYLEDEHDILSDNLQDVVKYYADKYPDKKINVQISLFIND